jgi:hypothetical protein
MAGIEQAFENFVKRVSSQEEPVNEIGDAQTGDKMIPLYQNKVPGYDVYESMPTRGGNYFQQDLADGGVAGLAITSMRPTQKEIDDFVNRPIPMGQMMPPASELLANETYQDYVRRKRRETGPLLFSGEPVTMPVLQSTQTETNVNPIARSLETAGFTKEEIMRILGQQGLANGGRVSMSKGGLTKTVPPAKGPDSQGVESLFRRRYS